MLDRVGAESGHATSLVRYAAGAGYVAHAHPGGEEILVLSGTFSEGESHHPQGWYMRNPPGSRHQPYCLEDTLIFVKLWQMAPDDVQTVRIDTRDPAHWVQQGTRQVCPLYAHAGEQVSLQRLAPGDTWAFETTDGAEWLVLAGALQDGAQRHAVGTWMRWPPGDTVHMRAGPQGATLYLKTGHLASRVSTRAST